MTCLPDRARSRSCKGDAVDAAKVIKNFAKENPNLVIKGGFMDGKPLTAADIQKIADLESREVLLSKLAGAMKAKQSQAAALFAAPLAKTARALGALQTKLESDPSAVAAAAPAAEEVVEAAAETVEPQQPRRPLHPQRRPKRPLQLQRPSPKPRRPPRQSRKPPRAEAHPALGRIYLKGRHHGEVEH